MELVNRGKTSSKHLIKTTVKKYWALVLVCNINKFDLQVKKNILEINKKTEKLLNQYTNVK